MTERVDERPEELVGASRRPPWFLLLPPPLVACLQVACPLFSEARGSGATTLHLRFRVLDADTSAPIAAATVRVQGDDRDEVGDRAECSPAGEAVIRCRFVFDFNSKSLVTRPRKLVSFDRVRVDVSASGYASARRLISELIGRSWDLQEAPFDRIAIARLRRSP